MLDLSTTPKGRIIDAAMKLAAAGNWRDVTMLDIAEAAELTLPQLRDEFSGKTAILAAFTRMVDDAVIAKAPSRVDGETARDRLFEVIMNRFDTLAPYKDALRSIIDSGGLLPDPAQFRAVMSSQNWMLQAAGIGTDGLDGGLKVAGLASVYAAVFRIWLDDDDPGMARTMAGLDRRLRRGEATISRLDDAVAGASDAVSQLRSWIGGRRRSRKEQPPEPPAATPAAPEPNGVNGHAGDGPGGPTGSA